MSLDKITKTKDFEIFLDRVKYFCSFIETYQSGNHKVFISELQKQLIQLYTYGQTLPHFDLPDDNDIKEDVITDKDMQVILSFIADRLHDRYYWFVFNPTDHDDTASVCGDLLDDLGDIYNDLKIFLTGLEQDNDDKKQDALWHLKWRYDNHWNDHCINAMYAIHYFLKHAF